MQLPEEVLRTGADPGAEPDAADIGSQTLIPSSCDLYSPDVGALPRSPRENAQRNLTCAGTLPARFVRGGGELLLFGAPGLGKTFLSACIARVVSEDGFSVVYDTAGHVFSQFESAKFRRDDDGDTAGEDVERCMNCDLLILDDLGTEMTTSFVQSALYQLLNGRLLAGRAPSSAPIWTRRSWGAATERRCCPVWRGSTSCCPLWGRISAA